MGRSKVLPRLPPEVLDQVCRTESAICVRSPRDLPISPQILTHMKPLDLLCQEHILRSVPTVANGNSRVWQGVRQNYSIIVPSKMSKEGTIVREERVLRIPKRLNAFDMSTRDIIALCFTKTCQVSLLIAKDGGVLLTSLSQNCRARSLEHQFVLVDSATTSGRRLVPMCQVCLDKVSWTHIELQKAWPMLPPEWRDQLPRGENGKCLSPLSPPSFQFKRVISALNKGFCPQLDDLFTQTVQINSSIRSWQLLVATTHSKIT